jgi:hypothetical protein
MVAKLVSTSLDRETDSAALEAALQRIVQRRILARARLPAVAHDDAGRWQCRTIAPRP